MLREGRPARSADLSRGARRCRSLGLLTMKPMMYVCNVAERARPTGQSLCRTGEGASDEARARPRSSRCRATIESEIAVLPHAEQKDYLEAVGLAEPGLNRVIRAGYDLLHLVDLLHRRSKEARAWTVEKGARAPQAAGVIHTDFEKGFIRAETIAYDDYVAQPGRGRRARSGQVAPRGQGLCRRRRRRPAFPLRHLVQ